MPLDLPAASEDWAPYVRHWTDVNLAIVDGATRALTSGGVRVRSADEVLGLLNDSDRALRNVSSFAELVSEVHPVEAVRTLAEESTQRAVKAATERGQNRALYEVLVAVDPSDLAADARRVLEKTILEFRRSGVDLDDAGQSRFREISVRSTVIDQDFSRIIRDDVRSIRIPPDRLAGLPRDYLEAHPAGADGLVTITTDYPDFVPFRMFAADAEARRELQVESLNRGWPDNDALLGELLELRDEQARLLGYQSWPDFDAELKMVRSGAAIEQFIEKLAATASSAGIRDRDVLIARLREDRPEASTIDAADVSYYTELVRREKFGVDAEEARPYFGSAKVKQGLLDVTGRLLGLEYRRVEDPATWHEAVDVFDVLDAGELIGRIHLDLHPRVGKFKHAAMFEMTVGVDGVQLAEGALVCNLPTGLMEHSHVTTLFHEFGHLMHHILARKQRFALLAGIATEWDFVEAPSQMLEEWAWDADVLRTFATNDQGIAIPADLVNRMRAANEFGSGLFVGTQTFYAAVSFFLHRDRPADRTAAVERLQSEYDHYAHIPGTHLQANFGHLTGYSSAYYTYMWSLVIAKDLFSAFIPTDLFDRSVAARYRDLVLVPGGSKDATELVREFLGRDYSFDAFEAWLNG
jgi:thimet oligopeptidase